MSENQEDQECAAYKITCRDVEEKCKQKKSYKKIVLEIHPDKVNAKGQKCIDRATGLFKYCQQILNPGEKPTRPEFCKKGTKVNLEVKRNSEVKNLLDDVYQYLGNPKKNSALTRNNKHKQELIDRLKGVIIKDLKNVEEKTSEKYKGRKTLKNLFGALNDEKLFAVCKNALIDRIKLQYERANNIWFATELKSMNKKIAGCDVECHKKSLESIKSDVKFMLDMLKST